MESGFENVPVFTVSDINRSVRELVEGSLMPVWVSGEIGSLLLHRSGHAYLTLKDSSSQLRAVFFGGAAECSRLGIANGSLVEAYGQLTVYEKRGEYQLGIRRIRLAGRGELQRRFDALKAKLEKEGLFDPARKKQLPRYPRSIGVITSPTGAAIRDFLNIIQRRFPRITVRIYPCAVQGDAAAGEVAAGVEFFNRSGGADVLVITRGGGSMEDLWPFNEEILARAVAASRIPVISAVGHEIDFSICDFVADLRLPTPSAAAELVTGRADDLEKALADTARRLKNAVAARLSELRLIIARAEADFSPRELRHTLEMRRAWLDELDTRISASAGYWLRNAAAGLDRLETTLRALSPQRQLERGYAVLSRYDSPDVPLKSVSGLKSGDRLIVRLADGGAEVVVSSVDAVSGVSTD